MTVAFVAIGDEVLRGETRETNGAALAQRLHERGLTLQQVRIVSDQAEQVGDALHHLTQSASLIITTGGLGPTDDDGTRQAVADLTGRPLREDSALAATIRARYERRGRSWVALNLRQALLPDGAVALPNQHGTAPGFAVQLNDAWIACLPGPPREVAGMLDDHLDDLLGRTAIVTQPVQEHCLRIFGITESQLQQQLCDTAGYDRVRIRSLPSFPELRLHVRPATGYTDGDAAMFAQTVATELDWRVFARRRQTSFAQVVVDELRDRDFTLAVAESCTGGLIGDMLTNVPGVSAVLLADFVTYANAAKRDVLGVAEQSLHDHGAVSEQVVRAMAEGAKRNTGADFAIATSGIAGPAGGSAEKPVGTVWFGVSGPAGTTAHSRLFAGLQRSRFKRLAAWSTLALLRRAVIQAAP